MRAKLPVLPEAIGLVAGSGLQLESLLDAIDEEILFSDLAFQASAGLGTPGVAGHAGRFVIGRCGKAPLILQCGRRHFYEGLDYAEVVAPVDALAKMGVRAIVFTNAAGGLNPEMAPGALVAIERIRPFVRYQRWSAAAEAIAPTRLVAGCDYTGSYAWVHGPSYETRAEIRALRESGAAAVGMSAGPEVHRAIDLGLDAAVISCITNNCCRPQVLTHAHVVETAAKASRRLCGLLREAIPTLL